MMDNKTFVFERKKYEGEQITPEIRQAIFDRVSAYSDHIIKYTEIPVCSKETIGFMFEKTNDLILNQKRVALLIDVTDTDVPDAEVRRSINTGFNNINKSVEHVAFVTGKKMFFNTLLKFIMFRTELNSYSIHATLDQGANKINKLLCVEDN